MRYQNVCLEAFGYTLPEEIVTSAEIEDRLRPVYQRLRLPEGRLELMTGIRERRFWPPGTLPSENSVISAEKAILASGVAREHFGALVHGSVCRDHLEPATACRVHQQLGLPGDCTVYDVSNACLGLLNGIIQVANMIELGAIRAGLVVGSEGGRELVETTIESLNSDQTLDRRRIKHAVASLTIGSGSCAVVLVDRHLSRTNNRILSATTRANSSAHGLCQSEQDQSVSAGMRPLMQTDAEALMLEGIATGVDTFQRFLKETTWAGDQIDSTICHQVGATHRRLLCEALGLNPANDATTYEWLGNTGAVALPLTMAMAVEQQQLKPGDRVGMFGIGSGINCLMLGVRWEKSLVSAPSSIRETVPDIAAARTESDSAPE